MLAQSTGTIILNEKLKFAKPTHRKRKKVKKEDDGLIFSKHKTLWPNIIDDKRIGVKSGQESELQQQCQQWLNDNDIKYIRIPDEAYRRKISKTISGIPDFIIFKRCIEYNKTLFVELKTMTGKLTQAQRAFAERLNLNIIRCYESFVELVNKFFEEG